MKKSVIGIVFFCSALCLTGQEDLRNDKAYFLDQDAIYQQWLDVAGLGDRLKVQEITVEDTLVNLYLTILSPYSARDSVSDFVRFTWLELKRAFDATSPIDLETQLFLKTLHIMDLEPQQATVQLYDTYDLSLTPLYFVGIHYEEDRIQITTSGHKAVLLDIEVPNAIVRNNTDGQANISNSSQVNAFTVRDKIKTFLQQRFGDANAQIHTLPVKDSVFAFTVSPLTRQVLADQQEKLICAWLNRLSFNCSTLKRERLHFTFTVTPGPKGKGYQLQCTLDGEFSEVTNLLGRRSEYKAIDRDPATKSILQRYGESLMGELQEYLMKY